MLLLDDGSYSIGGTIEIPGEGIQDFIFARGWLLEVVEVHQGDYYFISNGKAVRSPGSRLGVFYPPFTLIRAYSRELKAYNFGIGKVTFDPRLPSSPFIFDARNVDELR